MAGVIRHGRQRHQRYPVQYEALSDAAGVAPRYRLLTLDATV